MESRQRCYPSLKILGPPLLAGECISSPQRKMDSRTKTGIFFMISLLFRTQLCAAADTLLSGQSLTPSDTLVSKDGNFELGFFRSGFSRPGNSEIYYVGIWYKKISVANRTYVWIANRNAPLTTPYRNAPITDLASSELKLLENGNLVLYSDGGQSKTVIWSTNTTSNAMNSSQAVIGDDGNFVLRNGVRPFEVYWQSFDHLTDTWLPGGRIKYDNIMKKPQQLTSWRDQNDPSEGLFSMELDPTEDAYIIMKNQSAKYWTSGPWNGQIFRDVPEMRLNYVFNFSYHKSVDETHFTYDVYNSSMISRFVMDLSGQINMFTWDEQNQQWFLFWSQPRQQCEVYAYCGASGVCSYQSGIPSCKCMEGFRPRSQTDWDKGDFSSGGCVKEETLQCGVKDSFLRMSNVRLPINPVSLLVESADQCKSACLNNCSCSAYTNYDSQCTIWNGPLLHVQQLAEGDGNGANFSLRVSKSPVRSSGGESKGADKRKKVILFCAIFVGLLIVGLCIFIFTRWFNKQKGQIKTAARLHGTSNKDLSGSKKLQEPDVPMLKYEILAVATANFGLANKLGEGGFGSVYKGKLPSGEEIAVKRLSKSSGQGIEEFKNEVAVISRLQHRNLVKLLGFCIEEEEKMLIYEYMPNKSLDVIIFDPKRKAFLGWRKCFQIIEGIGRGILYLHRDSRLRVIHRDLKPSNILLDKDMNPKIADFGMARIVGGDELQANTRRVVGTYGYMSPEYAMDGSFSEKSDVFSFGVLLLEIVTGMKNTGFYHHEESISLIQHVWKLWNIDRTQEIIDPTISEPHFEGEILRCIQLGLLCVQEFAKDRPSMWSIISMLTSETTTIPTPKQPAFTERPLNAGSSQKNCSINTVSITELEAR